MSRRHVLFSDHIVADPEILGGKPAVKGTRIPVELVLAKLAHTPDLAELFADFPRLTVEDVEACLSYAAAPAAQTGAADGAMTSRLDRIRHDSRPTPPINLDE
jgi:uncharacterized protein (DUF433 family)